MIKYHMINPINKSYSEDFFAEQEQRGYTLDTRLNNTSGFWHFIKRAENEPAYTYSIVPIKDNKTFSSIKEKQVALDKTLVDAKEKGWQLVSSGYKVGAPTMLVFKRPTNQATAEIYDNKELERQALLNLYGQVKINYYVRMPMQFLLLLIFIAKLMPEDGIAINRATNIIALILIAAVFSMFFSNIRLIGQFKKANNVRLTENQTITHFNSKKYSIVENSGYSIGLLIFFAFVLSTWRYSNSLKLLALNIIMLIVLFSLVFVIMLFIRKSLISKMTEESKRQRNILTAIEVVLIILTSISAVILAETLASF